jgi:hypothetical protein
LRQTKALSSSVGRGFCPDARDTHPDDWCRRK